MVIPVLHGLSSIGEAFREWKVSQLNEDGRELVVCLSNPAMLVENLPQHNEQSSQSLVLVLEKNMDVYWNSSSSDFADTSTVIHEDNFSRTKESADLCDNLCFQHSLHVAHYISSKMKSLTDCVTVSANNYIPIVGIPRCYVYTVRDALMIEPLTSVTGAVNLPCLRGLVIWKEYLSDSGYYHVQDLNDGNANCQVKKRKVSLPKCVVHLCDVDFGDVLYLYLPDTPNAAGRCLRHFVVNIMNCKLKLSMNKRHIYLDFSIEESQIGK